MQKKTCLVTGSGGLIGSQTVKFFIEKGFYVVGIDNDMRAYFFGDEATTKPSQEKLESDYPNDFNSLDVDIRDYETMDVIFQGLIKNGGIDIIVHTAAQPSHDWAAKEPITDFTINANGTLNLLELTRIHCPKATFIYTSTNKVYGDRPNHHYAEYKNHLGIKQEGSDLYEIRELQSRFEAYKLIDGNESPVVYDFGEDQSIDNSLHSVFGASKLAADIMCQEYGKYHDMNVVILRGGCLTGPNHAGAELHGFLSYLIKCMVNDKPYTIFGCKGKQVRDNIHSWDLVNMFWHYHQNPKPGEVYNAGGGRNNSTSILEAIDEINKLRVADGLPEWTNYTVSDEARVGDHVWYISDLSKFKNDYPEWDITISLKETMKQIYDFEKALKNK